MSSTMKKSANTSSPEVSLTSSGAGEETTVVGEDAKTTLGFLLSETLGGVPDKTSRQRAQQEMAKLVKEGKIQKKTDFTWSFPEEDVATVRSILEEMHEAGKLYVEEETKKDRNYTTSAKKKGGLASSSSASSSSKQVEINVPLKKRKLNKAEQRDAEVRIEVWEQQKKELMEKIRQEKRLLADSQA